MAATILVDETDAETAKIPEIHTDGTVTDHRYRVLAMTRPVQEKWLELRAEIRNRQAELTENPAPADDEAAAAYIRAIALRLTPIDTDHQADELLTRLWTTRRITINRHLTPLVHHLYAAG